MARRDKRRGAAQLEQRVAGSNPACAATASLSHPHQSQSCCWESSPLRFASSRAHRYASCAPVPKSSSPSPPRAAGLHHRARCSTGINQAPRCYTGQFIAKLFSLRIQPEAPTVVCSNARRVPLALPETRDCRGNLMLTKQFELGLDTFGDVTYDAEQRLLPQAQVIRNVVAEAVLADQLGLDFFGV